jgi:hypothetical protein
LAIFTRISLLAPRPGARCGPWDGILARHEREFLPGAEEPLSLNQLLELLDASGLRERDRENAIACYLSAGEGWREAMKKIGGAFAEGESVLKERKGD